MGMVSYEEEYGYYYYGTFVPYLQEWAILPKPHMSLTIELCRHECEGGQLPFGNS